MRDRNVAVTTLIVTVAFASALIIPQLAISTQSLNPGYYTRGNFWTGGGMMGAMMSTQGETVSVSQAVQMMRNVPQYANVISSNDTIVFKGFDIKLVVIAAGHEELSNLTSNAPPGYATDDVFVIYGLVDPTLVVPHGAKLEITVVNLDEGMYHNFAFASSGPPYSYMAMQGMMYGQAGVWTMMPFLPPATGNGIVHEYSYAIAIPASANLWYLCTYPGHAQSGMYGRMLVAG